MTQDRFQDPLAAELYDLEHPPIGGSDCDQLWLPLARQFGAPVLELGCGTGRILIPLARAGLQVVGLDISEDMLALARRKIAAEPPEVQQRLTLVQANMADFRLDRHFNFIFVAFNTFQLLVERPQQESALRCVHGHLADTGRLALSVFHPRHDHLAKRELGWTREQTFTDPATGRTLVRKDRTTYDLATQTCIWMPDYEIREPDGTIRELEQRVQLHYFFRYEMELLLEKCGLGVEHLWGDRDRSPFTSDSPAMIFLARKG